MNHAAKALTLSAPDRAVLESWVSAHNTPQALVWRARIVLLAAEGEPNTHIAEQLGVTVVTVREWRKRFDADGVTQPGLPMKRGRCGTMTHDYKRHGTTSLFAALNVLDGTVVGNCYERHRHQEFLKFLRRLDSTFPKGKALHLILDNYGTHKHPNVKLWLEKHPRFHLHFTPTSSSWLNLIERWFGYLTDKQLRRGAFVSVDDLIRAIDEFIEVTNEDPKPFVWNAKVEDILRKVGKCKAILETVH